MAGSDKKLQSFFAFNSGEYSKDLAGRSDLESFGAATRLTRNFLTQVSGGLKKFYGTRHITEKTLEEGFSKIKLIPFINKYEPMVFVLYGIDDDHSSNDGIKVGLIYGDNYKDLDIFLPSTINVDELRWKQINDRLILVHKSMQPMSIDFYGTSGDEYVFIPSGIEFKEIPYFPIGSTDDFNGALTANGLSGHVVLSIPSNSSNIAVYFPYRLVGQSSYTRYIDRVNVINTSFDHVGIVNPRDTVSVSSSVVYLKRKRGTTVTTLASGAVNAYTLRQHRITKIYITDIISQERILQVIKTVYPQSYIDGLVIRIAGGDIATTHQDGDVYYTELDVGQVLVRDYDASTQSYTPWVQLWGTEHYLSDEFVPTAITTDSIQADKLLGRKIKFYFNDDAEVNPWWQGKTVNTGDYAYSNGHWYKATTSGTCGNLQPSHTFGTRSDGGVKWKYANSGSATASVISIPSSSQIEVLVENGVELPSNGSNTFTNYAWSIWGKDGVHPSDVYMVGNRLGFVCNTENYGSWNAMSVTDDYYNFSVEEYGEQLDTSAIVHLIGNNESSDINWVLARKDVYMGGYSGEYHLTPSASGGRSGAYTPTTTYTQNISNMGGAKVVPMKYKELNVFVGLTGKELYTIGYDYTQDDYTPKSLGYLTQHILDKGVKRIEPLNNLDRNIYLLHASKELSLFNYAAEQKVMGFSELDFGNDVIDFCPTYAKGEVAGYVAIKRNDGKVTFERFATDNPNYMFDEIVQGDGTIADFQPVPHFANRTVWIRYGDNFSQFTKLNLDSSGDVSHDPLTGVYLPQSGYFKIGLPMTAEVHTQAAFGGKVDGQQQQSLYVYVRLTDSGAFMYGSSVDFNKYFRHEYWNAQQEYGAEHRLFTGDMKLNIPLGYAEAQNQGEGPYPNTSGVGINIKSDTPEPLNLLSIQEIYK